VYSSGAGIALGLIIRRFLGLSYESSVLRIDPVIPAALDGLRVETTLLGRPVEVRYRIGTNGCGVNEIALNGQILSFASDRNPHRRGAALVPTATVVERLAAEGNILRIDIG
jgi:cellobiose phosphorylase